ncbi:hypothetical protein [Terrabacter sp. GCM10028922]|uniref:hypothetical protein n=1 Tax=Terrabacter sp. GCM10028922 TaxID=3273428 RepID=UPI0036D9D2D4
MASTALSGAVFLFLAPGLTSGSEFSGVALAWTFSTVFGLGVAVPTEQLINRLAHASADLDGRRAFRNVRFAAGSAIVLSAFYAWQFVMPGQGLSFFLSVAVAIFGWVAAAQSRALLLARGLQRKYAMSQVLEATARLVLVVLAFAARDHAASLLYAAIGLPLAAAALWKTGRAWGDASSPRGWSTSGVSREQTHFVLVALGYQFCLSGPPVLLGVLVGARLPETVGAFALASALLRAPAVVAGGATVAALSDISRLGHGDALGVRKRARQAQLQATGLTFAASALALLITPYVLPAIYGGPLALRPVTYLSLAAGTVMAVWAGVMTTTLLALGHGAASAGAWAAGALALAVVALVMPAEDGVLSLGLMVGPGTVVLVAVLMQEKFGIGLLRPTCN